MSEPRKICFLIPNLSDGGAQRQCAAIASALAIDPRVDFTLITLGTGVHFDEVTIPDDRLHVRQFRNFGDPRAIIWVTRTLRSLQPEVIVSWLHPADIISSIASKLSGTRWVLSERDSAYPPALKYRIRRTVGRHADGIVANSVKGADYWRKAKTRAPVTTIPNVVLAPVAKTATTVKEARALCIGRLEPQKNVAQVIDIFAEAQSVTRSATLKIVGTGSTHSALLADIHRRQLTNSIKISPFTKDVIAQYKSSRVLVSASQHEGMPNVLMEAVAMGLLPVVSRIPEHTAILGPDYRYYIDLDDTDSSNALVLERAFAERNVENHLQYARNILTSLNIDTIKDLYVDFLTNL